MQNTVQTSEAVLHAFTRTLLIPIKATLEKGFLNIEAKSMEIIFCKNLALTLIKVGLLGVCFGVAGKITPSKTSQSYVRNLKFGTKVHTHMQIQISTKTLLILLMSAFFCKKSVFFWQKLYLYQQQYMRCVKDFLFLFSGSVR